MQGAAIGHGLAATTPEIHTRESLVRSLPGPFTTQAQSGQRVVELSSICGSCGMSDFVLSRCCLRKSTVFASRAEDELAGGPARSPPNPAAATHRPHVQHSHACVVMLPAMQREDCDEYKLELAADLAAVTGIPTETVRRQLASGESIPLSREQSAALEERLALRRWVRFHEVLTRFVVSTAEYTIVRREQKLVLTDSACGRSRHRAGGRRAKRLRACLPRVPHHRWGEWYAGYVLPARRPQGLTDAQP
jgi:hypothetical protein